MTGGRSMRKNRSSIFIILIFLSVVFLSSTLAISQTVEHREKAPNEGQPPQKVMDAIGVKPGMVIGEVGAGRGRARLARFLPTISTRELLAFSVSGVSGTVLRMLKPSLGRSMIPFFPKGP